MADDLDHDPLDLSHETIVHDPEPEPTYKLVDVVGDTLFIELEDGRHVAATLADGVDAPKRGAKVNITSTGEDKGGAPAKVVVTGLAS